MKARQKCRGSLENWAGEGISLGGRKGFYGCDKGFLRESTAVLFKNHRGTLIKPPRYFLQSTAVVYLSEAGIDPKEGRDRPKGRPRSNLFLGGIGPI